MPPEPSEFLPGITTDTDTLLCTHTQGPPALRPSAFRITPVPCCGLPCSLGHTVCPSLQTATTNSSSRGRVTRLGLCAGLRLWLDPHHSHSSPFLLFAQHLLCDRSPLSVLSTNSHDSRALSSVPCCLPALSHRALPALCRLPVFPRETPHSNSSLV